MTKLNVHMLHDPSEIIILGWFGAQQTFLSIVNIEISAA